MVQEIYILVLAKKINWKLEIYIQIFTIFIHFTWKKKYWLI